MESEGVGLAISLGFLAMLVLCFRSLFLADLLRKEKKTAPQNPGALDSDSEEDEPEEDWAGLGRGERGFPR
eukprot:11197486-Alexandrium_andersonii.AAC.1